MSPREVCHQLSDLRDSAFQLDIVDVWLKLFPQTEKHRLHAAPRRTALCIFHNEKTPSLRVYSSSQRFHCYGCGKNGNVFDLILAVYKLEEQHISILPEASQKEDLLFIREKIVTLLGFCPTEIQPLL